VESDGEPEIAGASNHQAKKQPGGNHLHNAQYVLSVIVQMRGASSMRVPPVMKHEYDSRFNHGKD
jgi:hypothetical protein